MDVFQLGLINIKLIYYGIYTVITAPVYDHGLQVNTMRVDKAAWSSTVNPIANLYITIMGAWRLLSIYQ